MFPLALYKYAFVSTITGHCSGWISVGLVGKAELTVFVFPWWFCDEVEQLSVRLLTCVISPYSVPLVLGSGQFCVLEQSVFSHAVQYLTLFTALLLCGLWLSEKHMPMNIALGRLIQKDSKFEGNLSYTEEPCLNNQWRNRRKSSCTREVGSLPSYISCAFSFVEEYSQTLLGAWAWWYLYAGGKGRWI